MAGEVFARVDDGFVAIPAHLIVEAAMLISYNGAIPTGVYVRWVKASINLTLGASMPSNGSTGADYRAWVMAFQVRKGIPVTGNVDLVTQNKLIWFNHANSRYVDWIAAVLTDFAPGLSGPLWNPRIALYVRELQGIWGFNAVDGFVGPRTEWLLWDLMNEALIPSIHRPGM